MKVYMQGLFGDVYGSFEVPVTVPATRYSPEEFASRIGDRLVDEDAVQEVVSSLEQSSNDIEDPTPRINVNLNEMNVDGSFGFRAVYEAVGLVAVEHLLPLRPVSVVTEPL